MEIEEMIKQAQDAITVGRVFGTPYEKDGVMVIPAAMLRGGVGGGQGEQPEKRTGWGGGLGVTARPAGAYVVRNGDVTWQPAVDANRLLLMTGLIGAGAMLAMGSFAAAKARAYEHRPRLFRGLMRFRRAMMRAM